MSYDRDPKYLHPALADKLHNILELVQDGLPSHFYCKLVSGHRTPAHQFELFKKGRTFRNGAWRVSNRSAVVTNLDGFIKRSRHNDLPCTAIDIGIFDNNHHYITAPEYYQQVGKTVSLGFDWGGNWKRFVDAPHLEIPEAAMFQKAREKDIAWTWQHYLYKAGTYKGVADGIFGPKSTAALKEATGQSERNVKAWDVLYDLYGTVESHSYTSIINTNAQH